MSGGRSQRKYGFRQLLVLLLALVMLAGVCVPGIRASAAEEVREEFTVHPGEAVNTGVSGTLAVEIAPADGSLTYDVREGLLWLHAASDAQPGEKSVRVTAQDASGEQTFRLLVNICAPGDSAGVNADSEESDGKMTGDEETVETSKPVETTTYEGTDAPDGIGQGMVSVKDNGDGTYSMTITPREGQKLSAADFVIDGVDYAQYTWTLADGQALEIQGLIGKVLEESVSATGSLPDVTSQVFQDVMSQPMGIETYASTSSYNLYIYTLIPGKNMSSTDNPDKVWNGMGVGTIDREAPAAQNIGTVIYSGDTTIREQVRNRSIVFPDTFPDITFSDKTYKYAATSEQETQEGYYTIDWVRVVVSDGANAGNNNYNQTIPTGTNTYHLDGVITLNEKNKYTVNFLLQGVGETDFTIINAEKYSKWVDAGAQESALLRPDQDDPATYPSTKTVDGITYTLDGWYLDEACTQKATFMGTIDSNRNYYARYIPPTSLTIKKVFTGLDEGVDKPDAITVTVTGPSYSNSVTLNENSNYTATLEGLTPGQTYTVAEDNTKVSITNYDLQSVTYTPDGGSITLKQDGTQNEVTITNTYTKKVANVTITKCVTGNMGDYGKEFQFTVHSDQAMGASNDNSYTLSEDGKSATFTLRHDGSVILKDVPIGAVLTITESNADSYSTKVNNTEAPNHTGTYTVVDGENSVVVENKKDVIVDTGVVTDAGPYVLLLILAAIGGGALLVKRRGYDA